MELVVEHVTNAKMVTLVIQTAKHVNVTQLAQFKNPTTVTTNQAPVMQFQGVKPSMEEMIVDPVTLPLAITAPFRNAKLIANGLDGVTGVAVQGAVTVEANLNRDLNRE